MLGIGRHCVEAGARVFAESDTGCLGKAEDVEVITSVSHANSRWSRPRPVCTSLTMRARLNSDKGRAPREIPGRGALDDLNEEQGEETGRVAIYDYARKSPLQFNIMSSSEAP